MGNVIRLRKANISAINVDGLEGELSRISTTIRLTSSFYDPNKSINALKEAYWALSDSSLEYILVYYMDANDKGHLINGLLESLTDKLGILIEVKPRQDGVAEDTAIANYSGLTYILSRKDHLHEFQKELVEPSIEEKDLIKYAESIGFKQDAIFRVEAYKKHPVIKALLGLQNVDIYKKVVFQGRFPYLIVDTNPENLEFDLPKFKALFSNENTRLKTYRSFFYLANAAYLSEIDKFVRQQAFPIVFLASKNEARAITQFLYNFYDDACLRACVGKGRNAPGWLSKI